MLKFEREPYDISVEISGISSSLIALSTLFSECDAKVADHVIADSLWGFALQLQRICEEVAELSKPEQSTKNHLAALRKMQGLGYNDLEKLSGIPRETLRKIELDEEVILDTRSVAKLAMALHVVPSELFCA